MCGDTIMLNSKGHESKKLASYNLPTSTYTQSCIFKYVTSTNYTNVFSLCKPNTWKHDYKFEREVPLLSLVALTR